MTCSGYPLDSLDSVDRNGKSGMRVINEIKKRNFALTLPMILSNLDNNYLFLSPDLTSLSYEYVLNMCGYHRRWWWRRMRRGNPSDKGKTLGEGKAGTFPLLAINSNYFSNFIPSLPLIISLHYPEILFTFFRSIPPFALLVPILLHLYQIDCLLFHLDKDSALLITLNGKTNEHLDMLNSGIIYRLLEEKWTTFARVRIKAMSLSIL